MCVLVAEAFIVWQLIWEWHYIENGGHRVKYKASYFPLDFSNVQFMWQMAMASRANWGWNDSDLLLGTQDIQIISVDLEDDKISTSCKGLIKSEHLTEAPSQFAVHPSRIGHLACVGRNKVFLWTPEQNGWQNRRNCAAWVTTDYYNLFELRVSSVEYALLLIFLTSEWELGNPQFLMMVLPCYPL